MRGLTVEQMAGCLGGRLGGRWLHIGSCATLATRVSDAVLQEVLERTGAVALSGFRRPVCYIPSAAYELLLLTRLGRANIDAAGGVAGVRRWAQAQSAGEFAKLGFRMIS